MTFGHPENDRLSEAFADLSWKIKEVEITLRDYEKEDPEKVNEILKELKDFSNLIDKELAYHRWKLSTKTAESYYAAYLRFLGNQKR